jgi:hypothetical protein
MGIKRGFATIVGVLAAVVPLGGIAAAAKDGQPSRLPGGSEAVRLDPGDFTTNIDNPYWPMRPGSRWVYRETDPEGARQRVVVTVTDRTKRIANGITARVVHDVVTERGKPVEVTDDWYAQDRAGNVWYLGEHTTEYANGKPTTTEGSFEAGIDRAQPGVIMPARPKAGLSYRQEYYKGHAEDEARVLSLKEQVEVPFGHFPQGRVLMTSDLNPLKPKMLEYKFYARGVGQVLSVGVSGGSDREELASFHPREVTPMSAIDVRFRPNELAAERALASLEGVAGDGA